MSSRRKFLHKMGALTGVLAGQSLFDTLQAADFAKAQLPLKDMTPQQAAADEDYWTFVQEAYTVPRGFINLNNGGVSPAPKVVQEAVERYNKQANQGPSYYMWRILDQGREPLRQQLAQLAGADPEELAINRNATEALNTVIYGLPLQKGDEVIGTRQDYPNMIQAWKQRALRDGVVYKQIDFKFPIEDDQAIVAAFAAAITPKTKLLHLTHVINWVGQILPVKKIADMAHDRGIEVLIDGAHSFGLIDFKVPDLGGDYFGTSLHKFLSAPIGSGMLWIKREKIEKIWPLICADPVQIKNIRKFENLGTRSFPIEQGIGEAIRFHNAIGPARKEARIRYLKDYWASRAQNIPGVRLHTSFLPQYACAIAGFSIQGLTPSQIDQALMTQHQIHTVGIVWENISCVRVTPHVYTRPGDLDQLLSAIGDLAKKKA